LPPNPKHLGARIGLTSVLHTWGSAMTHHPHVHIIVPGGGLSADDTRWIACRPGFFLLVRVLSRLFRRLFLVGLEAAHKAGRLRFFGAQAGLADTETFAAHIAPLRNAEWVVYAKAPFRGPEQVLAYLPCYTHRVAISNSRLIAADADTVTFRWKDYCARNRDRQKVMTLPTGEFIRRFLLHVLPKGFHRIRHYGLFASSSRKSNTVTIRRLLHAEPPNPEPDADATQATDAVAARTLRQPCPACGGTMIVVETFDRGQTPRSRAPPVRSDA